MSNPLFEQIKNVYRIKEYVLESTTAAYTHYTTTTGNRPTKVKMYSKNARIITSLNGTAGIIMKDGFYLSLVVDNNLQPNIIEFVDINT